MNITAVFTIQVESYSFYRYSKSNKINFTEKFSGVGIDGQVLRDIQEGIEL